MNIDSENIEMWVMMMVDGELTADEQQEVKAFLLKNPQYESLINAFEDVKINTPEVAIIYPEIEQLLKPEIAEEIAINDSTSNNAKPLFTWKPIAIAASVCLIFGLMWMFKPEKQPSKIAMQTTMTTTQKEANSNSNMPSNVISTNTQVSINVVVNQTVIAHISNTIKRYTPTRNLDEPVIMPHKVQTIDPIYSENVYMVVLESNQIKAPHEEYLVLNDTKLVEEDTRPRTNIYFASLGRNNQPKEIIQELGEDMIHSISTINSTLKEIKKTNIEFQFASKTIKIK